MTDFINKKYVSINYTNRDFNSLRNDLINYAKRYYPELVKDFSEASFASMLMDTSAYVGDMLSFYLDYQINESLLATANDFNNVLRNARQLGYKYKNAPSAYGKVSAFCLVPANTVGLGPNNQFIPILKANTIINSDNGTSFITLEDLDFSRSDIEVAVARINNSTGTPITYALKGDVNVVSGEFQTFEVEVNGFQKFRRITLRNNRISEIVNVVDLNGNKYYEVDYLSQDIVFKTEVNVDPSTKEQTPNLLIPQIAPRRFIMEQDFNSTTLIFGGSDEDKLKTLKVAEPQSIILNRIGRNSVGEEFFDPSNLIDNDTMGIGPANTTLFITCRVNSRNSLNVPVGTLNRSDNVVIEFKDNTNVPTAVSDAVANSFEFFNDDPISVSTFTPTALEIKNEAAGLFASQNRAVTAKDYESVCYHMPQKFGKVRRVRAVKDPDSMKRNINLYVLSEDATGKFATVNAKTKQNIKTWLNNYRMINDSVDILDGRIVNFAITFEVVASEQYNKFEVLNNCLTTLRAEYNRTFYIGEPINVFEAYSLLNRVDGVSDVVKVKFSNKRGVGYSSDILSLDRYTTPDGRKIIPPENAAFEMKYTLDDIIGSIR